MRLLKIDAHRRQSKGVMMKRITFVGLIFAAVLACTGASAAPTFAGCNQVDKGEGVKFQTGAWKNSSCTEASNKKEETEYVKATLGKELRRGLLCALATASEEGFYADAGCSQEEVNGKYIKVLPTETTEKEEGGSSKSTKFSPEFDATAMGSLTLKAMGTTIFTNVAGSIECTSRKANAGEAPLASLELLITIEYAGCKAFGIAATISPASYEFDARGAVSLLSTVTLKAVACLVTFPSAKNRKLGTVKYRQAGKEIELLPSISKITSFGEGAACTYAEESSGTLTGNSLLGLANGSGSLLWK
jgi:hypothetical protein